MKIRVFIITALIYCSAAIGAENDWLMYGYVSYGVSSGFGKYNDNSEVSEGFPLAYGFSHLMNIGVGTALLEIKGDLITLLPLYFYYPIHYKVSRKGLTNTNNIMHKTPFVFLYGGGSGWAIYTSNNNNFHTQYVNAGIGVFWVITSDIESDFSLFLRAGRITTKLSSNIDNSLETIGQNYMSVGLSIARFN